MTTPVQSAVQTHISQPLPPTTKPATIYDVAQDAGVSHQTVSRYLAGYRGIRPETRERVERSLDRLGYRPNLAARNLKAGRSFRIGALTHDLGQVGPSRTAEGASVAAREAGYILDLITLDVRNPQAIERSLALLTQHSLDGVLALSSTDEMTRALHAADVRVPFHIHAEADDDAQHTTELTGVGIPALIAHLASMGHRDIVHIAGPQNWSASRNRSRAVHAAVAAAGLRIVAELPGDWSAESGYAALKGLETLPAATAYMASNDQMALGAMLALKERGLLIPEDVSVVGIDDIPEAAYFDPPLTTLRIDFGARGRQTVLELLAKIDNAHSPVGDAVPAPELIVRRSSGAAR